MRAHVPCTWAVAPLITAPVAVECGASCAGYMCTHWSESGTSHLGEESSSGLLSPSEAESESSSSESSSDPEGHASDALLHFSIVLESLLVAPVLSAHRNNAWNFLFTRASLLPPDVPPPDCHIWAAGAFDWLHPDGAALQLAAEKLLYLYFFIAFLWPSFILWKSQL